jgi:hypothetical protein
MFGAGSPPAPRSNELIYKLISSLGRIVASPGDSLDEACRIPGYRRSMAWPCGFIACADPALIWQVFQPFKPIEPEYRLHGLPPTLLFFSPAYRPMQSYGLWRQAYGPARPSPPLLPSNRPLRPRISVLSCCRSPLCVSTRSGSLRACC